MHHCLQALILQFELRAQQSVVQNLKNACFWVLFDHILRPSFWRAILNALERYSIQKKSEH